MIHPVHLQAGEGFSGRQQQPLPERAGTACHDLSRFGRDDSVAQSEASEAFPIRLTPMTAFRSMRRRMSEVHFSMRC
jgi:hypothetical protein